MKFKIAFAIIIGAMARIGISGGIGGGNPPSLELQAMAILQAGALEGDLIRYTEPGSDPVYLQPDINNMTDKSLSATVLPTGEKVVFRVNDPVEKAQTKVALGIARTMTARMGALPVMPVDIAPKPIIETVKVKDIDTDTMAKISAPQ